VGLSDSAIQIRDKLWIGDYPNSYAIPTDQYSQCWLAGEPHQIEWPKGAIRPARDIINVYGCGLVLDPEEKLWIFFTFNGQLMGELVLEIFEN
jgi:hypothetical protein